MPAMMVRPFSIDDILGYRGCRFKRERDDTHLQGHRKKLNICSNDSNDPRQSCFPGANCDRGFDIHKSVDEVRHPSEKIVRTQRHLVPEHIVRHLGQLTSHADYLTTLSTQQGLQDTETATGCDVERPFRIGEHSRPDDQIPKKRIRTIFTSVQLDHLEHEFQRQQYLVGTERSYLASVLHLTEAQVKVWFQNRRIKWRKQNLIPHSLMRDVPSSSSSISSLSVS